MNTIVQTLNTAGRAFVGFAVPVFIQASLLILILLAVDAVLRKKVRAVFRYWIWMLVLVKLVLPPSLWSPVSLGTWFGEKLEVPTTVLLEAPALPPIEPSPAELSPTVTGILSPPPRMFVDPPRPEPLVPQAPAPAEAASQPAPVDRLPALSLNWQGFVLLVWAATVAALLLLLVQRTFFVWALVAQGQEAGGVLVRELDRCRQRLGLRRPIIALRLSPNAASPAVCGLWRPVILIPQSLAARLRGTALDAVLLHELAHVRRGDLWINLAQTILQILYFYNPLLWLANAVIRRVREQAVDETVLVALGESAPQYPDTLIHVAKLALARRPALSLRLIGVVESKSALTSRIKHILNRPLPQTARLGLLGVLAVGVTALVLLPMAKGGPLTGWLHPDRLIQFESREDGAGTLRRHGVGEEYSKEYQVTFRPDEKLLVVAELYQTDRPMQTLGCRVFSAPAQPEKLAVCLRRQYTNAGKTAAQYDLSVTLGRQSLRLEPFPSAALPVHPDTHCGFFTGTELKSTGAQPYREMENLLLFASGRSGDPRNLPRGRIWIPGYNNVTWVFRDVYFILIKMLPLSQLDHLQVGAPDMAEPEQLPDGTILPADAAQERRQAVADEYILNLKRLLMRARMPLTKLVAHTYYRVGEPIHICLRVDRSAGWGPRLDEIYLDGDVIPMFFLIDGKEYASRVGFGPFAGGGASLDVLDNLYVDPGEVGLSPGRHTVAYGWKNVDVVDPNEPNHPVHFDRLATDPVAFEVVEELPQDYYRQVYQESWEEILRQSIETPFTDDWRKHGVAGPLLTLKVGKLPFDTAFAVYAQAEGSDEEYPAGELALQAGRHGGVNCSWREWRVPGLDWDSVGDRRWRIILKPSVEVAKKHPPIREFYAREFVTDWLTFARSPQFEEHRRAWKQNQDSPIEHEPKKLTFGPVMEREFGRLELWIDLDRNRTASPPEWVVREDTAQALLKWFRSEGIDAWAERKVNGLGCIDLVAVRLDEEAWTRFDARQLQEALDRGTPIAAVSESGLQIVYLEGTGSLPATYGFRTREGTLGILQDYGSDESSGTLRIRYKVLQATAARQASDSAALNDSRDSDGDGLPDYDEIHKYLTDPTKKDSDGDGIPDGDWNERREYTYSVRTVLRYMPPFHEEGLNDDFQDGRVLKQTNEYIEIEVIHYPFATGQESIPEDRNWRQDDTRMTEYLAPGPSTNWDEAMRRDLLAALKADGIDVETLTDRQVVERVPRWLLDRSRYLDKAFTTWFAHFPQGRAAVYPGLEEAFRRDFERDSSNYTWTLDQHLDHEVLGKGMFYNKTHGSCTSTAVYLTTVLRALGIPTRMILAAPAVDASDREQILMVKKAITHNRVRMTMLPALNRASHGTTNHIFNEVYVGNRWCRLDYSQLGCSNFGLHRFGLQTHLYTFNDLSDANLAPTWGRRYANGEHNDVFRHSNPYTAIEVSELFGPHGQVPNPPCTAQELDPHAKPDLFVLSPAGVDAWKDVWGVLESATFNKTSRFHERESYENLVEGMWLVRPQDFVVLLLALDKPERVPEGYEDLLPKPWPQIESQLQQGQTVELRGKARGMNAMVLAAPTADGLKPLVQNSKLLRAIGGSSPRPAPSPSAGATQTHVLPQSAAEPVRLAHDVTIELLGVCRHPSAGRQWWRPDGTPRETAPYQTGAGRMPHEDGYEEYELALQMTAPAGMSLLWRVPGGNRSSSTNQPSVEEGRYLRTIHSNIVNQRADTETASVSIGIAGGPWQTVARHETLDHEGVYPVAGDKAIALGVPYEKDGMTHVPTTTNLPYDQMDSRVVALDKEGNLHAGDGNSSIGGNILISGTSRLHLPLNQVKALLFQTRPWTWVTYKDVSLRPGRRTNVTVELQDSKTAATASPRAPRQGKVVGLGPAWEVLKEVLGPRYWGSIGGFSRDPVQTKQYFDELLVRMSPGDTFVLMFAFDRPVGVPPEHADLLPLPWSEIESRARKGESVEAQGEARGLTVIILAAPTSGQLDTLVRQSHLLDAFRPNAAEESAAVASSPAQVRLPNGVTVELLGVCDFPSQGKQWWRPDGAPSAEAPYDRWGALVWPDDPNKLPFELAVRVRNLPENWDARIDSPDNRFSNAQDPPYKAGRRLPELRWLMMEADPNQTTCRIRCDIAAPWQVMARSSPQIAASPQTPGSGVVFSEIREGFGGGRVFVSGRDSTGEGVSVTVTGRVGGHNDEWLFGVEGLHRVVAILKDGKTQTAPRDGFFFAETVGQATAYFPRLSLADVQQFQFQIRALTQVDFRNVPLRRDLKTDVTVDVRSADTGTHAASLPGAEREIVLPEADRQPVVLDLATGELVPLPPVGPEPEKMQRALRKLGKGDLLYDCDLVDRTLILLRDAASKQAQEDTGEPSVKGHLIGQHLPEVLTVKTAEGRLYRVTIVAADDDACTLKYSPIPTDRGAGGGAPLSQNEGLTKSPREPGLAPRGVNIYLLADENIDLETARAQPLSALVLRKEPWIASADIERYDLSSHAIYLKNSRPLPFRSVALRGNPFVVTAEGQRCYLGSLWTDISSFLPEQTTPLIYVPNFDMPPDVVRMGQITIVSASGQSAPDVRQDARVLQALTANGQLHAGLEIRLDRVEVLPREGGSSVQYTYTLRNKDTDNLYVLDPGKMGIRLFRFFGHAPFLRSTRGDGRFQGDADLPGPFEPPGQLDMAWFSLLQSGASMTRTVTLSTYPRIPPDRYVCSFRFNSPGRLATKDKRERPDGRIWVGQIDASLSLDTDAFQDAPATTGKSAGALAAPGKDVDVLAFRITPKVEEVGAESVEKYKQALTGGGPLPDDDFAWFEVRPGTVLVPQQITCAHDGKTYLLLWNDKAHVMRADGTWGLEEVRETTDDMGRPSVVLTFDATGVRLLHALGDANLQHGMAVVFEGRVIAIPFISTTLSGTDCPIIGRFTAEETKQIATGLKRVVASPPPQRATEFTPPGTAAPGSPAPKGSFSVYGIVTDQSGRPMAGVKVTANCGITTLQSTGQTLTDEAGRYLLRFGSAFPSPSPEQVMFQAATICARRSGFYEVSLCRQGRLAMAGTMPSGEKRRLLAPYVGVVLPDQPYKLDFVMRPGAQVIGELVDAQGQPLSQQTVVLTGDGPLYPSSNVLAVAETEQSGAFLFDAVPLQSFWFEYHASSWSKERGRVLARSRNIDFTAPGTWRIKLKYDESAPGTARLTIADVQPPAPARAGTESTSQELSGQVVDPNGHPLAGAQVALCTQDKGVIIQDGRLQPTTWGGRSSEIVNTDAQGRFAFPSRPEEFHVIAAHDLGFVWVTGKEWAASADVRLAPWARIEGTLRIGRELGVGKRVSLLNFINKNAIDQGVHLEYRGETDAAGRFSFQQVPPTWMEVGYLIRVGDSMWTDTSRTPIHLQPGQSLQMTLGGEGRPVVGRFVPPADYQGPVYFGAGLRAFATQRPDLPKPADYDRMTQREQQEWLKQWHKTPAAEAFYDARWHDLNRRHYSFPIEEDGSFRIEDVIPGKYNFTVWLEERFRSPGRPEEIGGYYGTVEVPPPAEAYMGEPLDLGDLTLKMRNPPLHIGDLAPRFEAKTLDGKDIRLIDCRGKFVLLSFWQPTFHPELARLKELQQTHGADRLAIIDFAVSDTLQEVESYIREHQIEWPEIYLGENKDNEIAKRYGDPVASYILLVDPEGKIVATWLRGEKLTSTVVDALKNAPAVTSTPSDASSASLAWQRTDRYVPPDPDGFFPDDPDGGKRLDMLFQAVDKDQRPDEEILSTVRQGFRRTTQYRTLILAWIGRRYIWGKDPQNPQAVEILYHAVPLERHYAIYFGLSVLRNKPPNVLRTLADVCMRNTEEVGRISWGLGPQGEALLPYLTPYLQDPDAAKREIAAMLVKHFKGELDFEQWQRDKRQEQTKAQFSGQLPQIRQTLLTGDSDARYRALTTLLQLARDAGGPMFLDDSLLPALQAASTDPDRRVRNEVVRTVGSRWIWSAQRQDPNAIELMLRLSTDSDREVRYNAVYYGLSVVRDKSEPVVRRLVELALTDHENNLYGRIVWGLRTFSRTAPDPFARILAENLDRAKTDVHHAASVYLLYRDILEKEPPEDWSLSQVPRQYPEDLFILPFSAREPFQPESTDALWSEFARGLPEGTAADRLPIWDTNAKHICYARIRGKEQAVTVRDAIANHPRLRAGEVRPLPLATQLYLQEKHGVAPAGTPGAPSQSPADTATRSPISSAAITSRAVSGRVMDPNGSPLAGAQVALCTKDKGVRIHPDRLQRIPVVGGKLDIVTTDRQGHFAFAEVPQEFALVVVHEAGFAQVPGEGLASAPVVRLEPWGRIEGTVRIGRQTVADRTVSFVSFMHAGPARLVDVYRSARAAGGGRFVFEKVPPGWYKIGLEIETAGRSPGSTNCRSIRVSAGQTREASLGGTGRPVIGRFVPPQDHKGPLDFTSGIRVLETVRPEVPSSADGGPMNPAQRGPWLETAAGRAWRDSIQQDPDQRGYTFRIEKDGTFRIEDVIPGRYELTVLLAEGPVYYINTKDYPVSYRGAVEVPALAQEYADEPLNLGAMMLKKNQPPQ